MNKKLLAQLIEVFLEEILDEDYVFLDGNVATHAHNLGTTRYYTARVNDNKRGEVIYVKIDLDYMSEHCFNLEDVNNHLIDVVLEKTLTQYELNKLYKENPDKVITTFLEKYVKCYINYEEREKEC